MQAQIPKPKQAIHDFKKCLQIEKSGLKLLNVLQTC